MVQETGTTCRERCGGQGYLSVNRFGHIIGFSHAGMTAEGDNRVLMQKARPRLFTPLQACSHVTQGVQSHTASTAMGSRFASARISAVRPEDLASNRGSWGKLYYVHLRRHVSVEPCRPQKALNVNPGRPVTFGAGGQGVPVAAPGASSAGAPESRRSTWAPAARRYATPLPRWSRMSWLVAMLKIPAWIGMSWLAARHLLLPRQSCRLQGPLCAQHACMHEPPLGM